MKIPKPIKKVAMFPVKLADKYAGYASGAAGAVGLTQVPGVINQYAGDVYQRAQELGIKVDEYKTTARITNQTLDELTTNLQSSSDHATRLMGEGAQATIERHGMLTNAYEAITNADIWYKPLAFLQHVDNEILDGTMKHLELVLPKSTEEGVYCAVGLGAGALAYHAGTRYLPAAIKRGAKGVKTFAQWSGRKLKEKFKRNKD
jgi:hypothetical protein|tara:strand:- start:3427 stop:4038 length:612 start_codon:yes stop_codon:yes gene_type:complete